MHWTCRKLLHEDFAKETVAHQTMEQVLINVTDELMAVVSTVKAVRKRMTGEKNKWTAGGRCTFKPTHLHYTMHFACEVWLWWDELSGMISWQVSQMASVQ